MAVGKISGAVGNAAHLGPEVEDAICKRLGLDGRADRVAGDPARPARAVSCRAGDHGGDARKDRARNPPLAAHRSARGRRAVRRASSAAVRRCRTSAIRWRCEQICGLARVVRANSQAALENIALWHERDISHSSVERVILPDSTILADYMLARMTDIVAKMRVFPERMRRNLDSTKRAGVFRAACCRTWWKRARRARTPTNGCRSTPWRRGRRTGTSARWLPRMRISGSGWETRGSSGCSIWGGSCGMWTRFSRACLGRNDASSFQRLAFGERRS